MLQTYTSPFCSESCQRFMQASKERKKALSLYRLSFQFGEELRRAIARYKKRRIPVSQCERCGRAYLKTREGQVDCLFCLGHVVQ